MSINSDVYYIPSRFKAFEFTIAFINNEPSLKSEQYSLPLVSHWNPFSYCCWSTSLSVIGTHALLDVDVINIDLSNGMQAVKRCGELNLEVKNKRVIVRRVYKLVSNIYSNK